MHGSILPSTIFQILQREDGIDPKIVHSPAEPAGYMAMRLGAASEALQVSANREFLGQAGVTEYHLTAALSRARPRLFPEFRE